VRPTANKQEFSRCRDNLMGLLRIRLERYRTTTMRYERHLARNCSVMRDSEGADGFVRFVECETHSCGQLSQPWIRVPGCFRKARRQRANTPSKGVQLKPRKANAQLGGNLGRKAERKRTLRSQSCGFCLAKPQGGWVDVLVQRARHTQNWQPIAAVTVNPERESVIDAVVLEGYAIPPARPPARFGEVTCSSTCSPARVAVFTSASRLNWSILPFRSALSRGCVRPKRAAARP
jgi:hypothetical protein